MISGATTCFQNGSQGLQMYSVADDVLPSSLVASSSGGGTQSSALLYNLSILKDKVHQVQSLLSVVILPDHHSQAESVAVAVASMGTIIQEIIITASSMMFTCQQLSLGAAAMNNNSDELHRRHHDKAPDGELPQATVNRVVHIGEDGGQGFLSGEHLGWYDHCVNCNNISNNTSNNRSITISNSNNNKKNKHNNNKVEEKESSLHGVETTERLHDLSPSNYDIIELDAADLLAKYTHYCQVCGKGFKRDANLRMHMRAHGDEYKSAASLSNPMKNSSNSMEGYSGSMSLPRKYSCPEEGCRWNRKHAKFQPLKSMVCVKNHYKRSHCPKMYVCNRCNQKQFSVLSDLRTHEKHCGDLKWQCSCGTTFSRKDKLMGHVSLFIGHTPADNSFMKQGAVYQQHAMKIQLNNS